MILIKTYHHQKWQLPFWYGRWLSILIEKLCRIHSKSNIHYDLNQFLIVKNNITHTENLMNKSAELETKPCQYPSIAENS